MERDKLYSALTQMACNSEQVRGQRFYYYLVSNSILILAWAQLYPLGSHIRCFSQSAIGIVLLLIPIVGIVLSICFFKLFRRSGLFLNHYIGWAAKMEKDPNYNPKPWLWTALLRERMDDIRQLDKKCRKCLQQLSKDENIKNFLIKYIEGDFWVREKRILPCKHNKQKMGVSLGRMI